MKLGFSDNAAAVADPQVKAGVEKGIAVSSGLGEENADMVEATLSLVTSRRLSAALRQLSGFSVQVDFEIYIPAEDSATIDAYDVADSLASVDEDSLNSALSEAIASVADAGYSVEVAELPSVDPIVASTPTELVSEKESSISLLQVAAIVIGAVVIGGWLVALGVVYSRRRSRLSRASANKKQWSAAQREPSRELSREYSI
jgi:hypothetical protein